jgi:hypothetical protein
LPQAKKKSKSAIPEGNQIAHRLSESVFILTILLAVYLVACLASYDPTDPGPFNTVASDQVSNIGRVLGAWLSNFFLFLTGYLAYALPLVLIFIGWLVYDRAGKPLEKAGPIEWLARLTGLLLFILSATGLAQIHTFPPAGSMPAGGGGVIGLQIATPILQTTGVLGSTLFLLAMLMVGLTLFAGISWFRVMDVTGKYTLASIAWLGSAGAGMRDWFAGRRAKAQRVACRVSAPLARNNNRCSRTCRRVPCLRWNCWMIRRNNRRVTAPRCWKPCPGRSNSSWRISASRWMSSKSIPGRSSHVSNCSPPPASNRRRSATWPRTWPGD